MISYRVNEPLRETVCGHTFEHYACQLPIWHAHAHQERGGNNYVKAWYGSAETSVTHWTTAAPPAQCTAWPTWVCETPSRCAAAWCERIAPPASSVKPVSVTVQRYGRRLYDRPVI